MNTEGPYYLIGKNIITEKYFFTLRANSSILRTLE